MKKIILAISTITSSLLFSQFKVEITLDSPYQANNAFLYQYDGSQESIAATGKKVDSKKWVFQTDKAYTGFLKIYFPESNESIALVSNNNNVSISCQITDGKIKKSTFSDGMNNTFLTLQSLHRKREQILPVLLQMQNFYQPTDSFAQAMKKEIELLSTDYKQEVQQYPFLDYFFQTGDKYNSQTKNYTQEDILSFLQNTGEFLETSTLLRPILVDYLSLSKQEKINDDVDKLIKAVDIETPRGQIILSELIDIFNIYDMESLRTKYLSEAKSLTCSVGNRLKSTIKSNGNTEIGAKFPNYNFTKSVVGTNAKSIADVKASKKIILFWSSTCSHCEAELPKIIEKYNFLKENNIEVIGISLDSNKSSYENKIKGLPWINDSELRGWNSSFIDTYYLHETPTYFVLDANNKIIAKPVNFTDFLNFINNKK